MPCARIEMIGLKVGPEEMFVQPLAFRSPRSPRGSRGPRAPCASPCRGRPRRDQDFQGLIEPQKLLCAAIFVGVAAPCSVAVGTAQLNLFNIQRHIQILCSASWREGARVHRGHVHGFEY